MRDLRTIEGATHVADYPPTKITAAFVMVSVVDGAPLRIIASAGAGWDHVSVSRKDRCPDWTEMEQVKRACFHPAETAMQLHVPPADHINNHEFCLHLWRPLKGKIPRPPGILVGQKGKTPGWAARLGLGVF